MIVMVVMYVPPPPPVIMVVVMMPVPSPVVVPVTGMVSVGMISVVIPTTYRGELFIGQFEFSDWILREQRKFFIALILAICFVLPGTCNIEFNVNVFLSLLF